MKTSGRKAARWAAVHVVQRCKGRLDKAARQVGKKVDFVRKWYTKWQQTGNVDDEPRSGRKRLISDSARAAACTLVAEEQSVPVVTAILKEQQLIGGTVSSRTVLRAVSQDMELKTVEQRPILSDDSRKKRVKFCRQQHDSDALMAADSTYFTLGTVQKRRKYWVRKGQKAVAGRPNRNAQLHVYAGITKYGKTTLRLVSGTTGLRKKYYNQKGKQLSGVGAQEYQEVLQDTLVPQANQIFAAAGVQQWSLLVDNAPAHNAGPTKQYYAANNIRVVKQWPPNSPDLNPIETAWAWCKQRVYSKHYNSLDELWTAVQDTWEQMPLSMCKNLMDSLAKRKQICLDRNGGYTGY